MFFSYVLVAMYTVQPTMAGFSTEIYISDRKFSLILQTQQNYLQVVGCHPKMQLIEPGDVLEVTNSLADYIFYLQIFTTERCLLSSFCRNYKFGIARGSCFADPLRVWNKRIIVFYYVQGSRIYRSIDICEHTSCIYQVAWWITKDLTECSCF